MQSWQVVESMERKKKKENKWNYTTFVPCQNHDRLKIKVFQSCHGVRSRSLFWMMSQTGIFYYVKITKEKAEFN